MKAAFISALAAFAGIAAAEPICTDDSYDRENVEKRENCMSHVQNIIDNPDAEFTTEACYSVSGCAYGCEIQVCAAEGTKFTNSEISHDLADLLKACAPEANTPFQGQITTGGPDKERTIQVFKPDTC